MRKNLLMIASLGVAITLQAQEWTSHFAYNNVTQIAMAADRVYALSDGSLFSVEKQTEEIKKYDRQTGLHSVNITCIAYDNSREQLLITYENGKIDLLSNKGTLYVGGLYDKDMTQRKTVYNVSLYGHTAYLSTHFGIQTLDLRDNTLVDSYWLRPNGEETPVYDVLIKEDTIYAFGADSLFSASLQDNLSDYNYWKREKLSGRISQDTVKGKHYQDEISHWYASGAEGIVRFTQTERLAYKPQGPLSNIPYRLYTSGKKIWIVQGGRWSAQFERDGVIMMYENGEWTNIPSDSIRQKPKQKVLDFMNVATDPTDKNHYFVTSFGTGLYEFEGTKLINHWIADSTNTLGDASGEDPASYTRLDFAQYDSQGNLWLVNAGGVKYQLSCLDVNGEWHGLPLIVGSERIAAHTPGGFILDIRNQRYKWIATARYNTSLFLLDDGGTPYDSSDDRAIGRKEWISQKGQTVTVNEIFATTQMSDGRIWLGTEQGIVIIDTAIDYFHSNLCLRPDLMDDNGENPMVELRVKAFCEDKEGNIWVGTETLGVYVLNSDATEIIAHYTTDNSSMPSNSILSIARDEDGVMYIGTGSGLAQYTPRVSPEGLSGKGESKDVDSNYGTMQQWRLHFSYQSPQELVATSSRIYATANGALFYVDRETEQMEYLNKATGLNGSTIAHIAYDEASKQLIIAYEDGRIDLLDEENNVRQMPDIYMKAGSSAVTINAVSIGKRGAYLAMPYGILAINPRKAEVSDTYYIGEDAGAVDVKQIIETEDSLYAFSRDYIYSASISANLVDYAFWHKQVLPSDNLEAAFLFRGELYILQNKTLYRRRNGVWSAVLSQPVQWGHVSGDHFLLYASNTGLFRLTIEDKLEEVNNKYYINDAIYSLNEYWLAENGYGLIRVRANGDDYFHTNSPNSNFGYFLGTAHGQIYATIGGRWASQYSRYTKINIYDGNEWRNIDASQIISRLGVAAIDPVSIAVDSNAAGHFFVATYGTGVFEFKNYEAVKQYSAHNSTLRAANSSVDSTYYTRTDGAMYDNQGNLWVLNATEIGAPLHVMSEDGLWHALSLYSGGKKLTLTTPLGIWTDRRNENYKWMFDQRYSQGVILLDDGGTPTNGNNDRCIKRTSFVDQNGRTITPSTFRCFTQDLSNRIWIGTESGILVIPTTVDFFQSNACRRVIIPRNDGTELGDYLLGEEQINCMAVDGGNRIWIGTASSGLYLMEDDTITVAHFTEHNSLLPSNTIQSIVIHPTTGEVFVGTDKGIASYRSDASEAQDDFSHAYAFPNPVKPDYSGIISIVGLMDETIVNIIDAGGNLVCKTRSHGGTAVWDGKLPDGRRATPGVYTALCNAESGHGVVKILVIR